MEDLGIHITHCSERNFLDSFRTDLANATSRALILSPFVSNNRAIHYYPALSALVARGVSVEIYSKPRKEQPASLCEQFDEVEHQLKRIGVRFHGRAGMHEKIAAVDDKILWHGSLNILSHNDTRESMLRFDSPELVREVLTEIGLSSPCADIVPPLESKNNGIGDVKGPACPICGGDMLPYDSASLWICRSSPKCPGIVTDEAGTLAELTAKASPSRKLMMACPICGSEMILTKGVVTRINCSSESCGFAFDHRIAAGLLRVLSRRGLI